MSSCVWCNQKDWDAFRALWNGVFHTVRDATGHSLNFCIFDKKSSLLGVLTDKEGAQALGLADCLDDQKVNNEVVSGINASGQELLLYIYKTCWIHYWPCTSFHSFLTFTLSVSSCSNIKKLESFANTETINYLQNFPFLDTDAEIHEFDQFCSTLPVKQVRGTVEYLFICCLLPFLLSNVQTGGRTRQCIGGFHLPSITIYQACLMISVLHGYG